MRRLNPVRQNPKLEGSMLVDCIPQVGNCPNECLECISGDTSIPLLNGLKVPIKELTGRNGFWVFSCTEGGEIVPGYGHSVRISRTNAEVFKVTLDNNESLICTVDHLWLMRNGSYKTTSNLKIGDSLMPLYLRESKYLGKPTRSYLEVYQPSENKWRQLHRQVIKFKMKSSKIEKGMVVHHKNFNSLDNTPENLDLITKLDHDYLHSGSRKGLKRPNHSKFMKIFWKSKTKEEIQEFIKNTLCKTLEERNKSGVSGLSMLWKLPDFREKSINASRERNLLGRSGWKLLWKDTDFKNKMIPILVGKNNIVHRRFDPDFELKRVEGIKSSSKFKEARNRHWTFARRKQHSEFMKKFNRDRKSLLNHKIVSVEFAGRQDVYDMSVELTHNFAVSAGVFVHNCYYNGGGFFTDKKSPLIPTLEEVGNKIVRVNSGHDSNLQKELVLSTTEKYPKKFYNTSLPNFEFPAPVVFTCNGRDTDFSAMMVVRELKNLMEVRFRTNLWNLDLLDEVVSFYAGHGIPVTITFMRYTDLSNIPEKYRKHYEMRKSILNVYYCLSGEEQKEIVEKYPGPYEVVFSQRMVGMCGTPESSYCRDCHRCVWAYNKIVHQNEWIEAFNSISVES